MMFYWYRENTPLARCIYEGTGRNLRFISYEILDSTGDKWWHMLPMPRDDATLYAAMAERVVPEYRFNPSMLEEYATAVYNPEIMCRAVHGANPQDPCWMKYEDDPEDLTYEDVRIQ